MKTPEGHEKQKVDAYLASIGAYNAKPMTAGYGASGLSDRLVCIVGTFWGIEVKREGKEPTVLQNRRMNEIKAAGGNVAWGTADKIIGEIELWRAARGLMQRGFLRG